LRIIHWDQKIGRTGKGESENEEDGNEDSFHIGKDKEIEMIIG